MHSSWLYYITGISGYAVESQKLVRKGKERLIRNAARLARCGVLEWGELAFLAGCPVVVALAVIALILRETRSLADRDEKPASRAKSRSRDAHIVIRLAPKASEDGKRKCPDCGGGDVKFRKGKVRRIRSLDFGRVKVYVEVEVRRIRCPGCGRKFYEKIPFLAGRKARVTRAFEREMYELRAGMSITAVAEWLDVDPGTVKDAEKRILNAKYRRIDLKGTRIIGIDELYVFRRARSDRKYVTVVRDMETGAVLNVSRGKGGDALRGFLARLRRQRPKIECVCMDMSNAYEKWVREFLPRAEVVFDHFHLVKAMNEKVNSVRRRAAAGMDAELRKAVKGCRRILTANAESLDGDGKARLAAVRGAFGELSDAYAMKEMLRGIYSFASIEYSARLLLEDWCETARMTKVPELESMARTVKSHLEGILGYWRHAGASNASSEGFNTKIRRLIQQAYGLRDREYFRLKVFALPKQKARRGL